MIEEEADSRRDFWWQGERGQRFWMKIAGAKAPGIDLRAPITMPDERPIWH